MLIDQFIKRQKNILQVAVYNYYAIHSAGHY